MEDVEKRPWLRSWMIWAGGGFAALVVILLIAFGDGGDSGGVVDSDDDLPAVDRDQCRKRLSGTLGQLQPSQLGISSSADELADDLNIWWADCGSAAVDPVTVESDSLRTLLAPEVFDRTVDSRFDDRDAAHIRDCLLYREVAKTIAASFDQDLDRAVAAFDFVVREVADLPQGSNRPPLPCLYAALFGQAESRQRAWLFAEVLRQLGVDCAIIEPVVEDSVDEPGDIWLVGAIVAGEGVYLFDPTAGVAIPGPSVEGEAVGDTRPATLREVRNNDDLLRRLDIPGGPDYPWTAGRFQQITAKVIGDGTWWSPRMARLQNELPGEFSTTIFDGLTDNPYRSAGLLDRVRQAGAGGLWDEGDVSVWGYPEAQTTAFHAAGGEQGAAIAERIRVLKAPRLLIQQDDGTMVETDSARPLRIIRFQHLAGELGDALQGFGTVRFAGSSNPVTVNEVAAEDAVYWIALCQYEMHREDKALSILNVYLRDYPAGIWLHAVRTLRAHCYARLGRYDEAAQSLLEKSAGGTPLSFGDAFYVREWQAMAGAVESDEAR